MFYGKLGVVRVLISQSVRVHKALMHLFPFGYSEGYCSTWRSNKMTMKVATNDGVKMRYFYLLLLSCQWRLNTWKWDKELAITKWIWCWRKVRRIRGDCRWRQKPWQWCRSCLEPRRRWRKEPESKKRSQKVMSFASMLPRVPIKKTHFWIA